MARKKKGEKSALWMPEEGGRALRGFEDDDDARLRVESVEIALDDAGVRKLGDECKALLAEIKAKRRELTDQKNALSQLVRREASLMRSMVERVQVEERRVYVFADDGKGTARQYDADTKELLGTRDLTAWEMQLGFEDDPDHESDDQDSTDGED